MNILITGITGMDGSILARKHLAKGDKVFGLVRRTSSNNLWRIKDIKDQITFLDGDLTDYTSLITAVLESIPQRVYNMAAQSHVGVSFKEPMYTLQVTGIGAINMINAVSEFSPRTCRFYQASSSEMFGQPTEIPQNEDTPLKPMSPYACAKVLAHNYAEMMRKKGMWITCGILNNHECEVRGGNFLTTKVAKAAARKEHVNLGNLTAERDWSYAPNMMDGVIAMIEHDEPDTFVLGTGIKHTVEDFVSAAYHVMGLDWNDYVTQNTKQFVRPLEAGPLCADYRKAERILGWQPTTSFYQLSEILVKHFESMIE